MQATGATQDYSSCFSGLLDPDYVKGKVAEVRGSSPAIEQIKQRAAVIANSMYHPDAGIDANIVTNLKLGRLDELAHRAAKGIVHTIALAIACDQTGCHEGHFFDTVKQAVETAEKALEGDTEAAKSIRKKANEVFNYGGYYERTELNLESLPKSLEGRVQITKNGHLAIMIPADLVKAAHYATRPEITQQYLTSFGERSYELPYDIEQAPRGHVLVFLAYAHEEWDRETDLVDKSMTVVPQSAYVVPVRGDCRYALVGSMLIDPEVINETRTTHLKLEPHDEAHPPRITFGAVRNPERVPVTDRMAGVTMLQNARELLLKFGERSTD